jgi:hypothetical protein
VNGTIVFLTSVWAPGYGVSVVIAEQCRILAAAGWRCVVGAIRLEPGMPRDIEVVRLPYRPVLLRPRLESLAPALVVACTSPFPAALAGWKVPWIQWEHGRADQPEGPLHLERAACERVGPSRWLVSRFEPGGIAIPNGADQLGRVAPLPRPGQSLRVVSALRGGAAEARYKGNAFLMSLPRAVGRPDLQWRLMLRGAAADLDVFRAAGWHVVPDPDRETMAAIWRASDLHLAPSRIESFDLPLAEAQHLGCAGLALDGGAHGELCPFVFATEDDLVARLRSLDRQEVDAMRAQAFERVVSLTWKHHGEALLALVGAHARPWRDVVPAATIPRLVHAAATLAYDLARKAGR